LANVEHEVLTSPETVYEIASLTKQFTASAVMLRVEEGKLGLDDKIARHLDALPQAWSGVTVRQMLNHTSGICNYQAAADYSILNEYDRQDLIRLAATLPVEFPPGERWSYSNTGYVLLGGIIEKISGQRYEEFLNERIFKPLKMTATRLNDHQTVIPHRASGYAWKQGAWVNVPRQRIATSGGGIVSTVLDLAKWDAALSSHRILKLASLTEAWTPARVNDGSQTSYGFGWFVTKINGRTVVEHTGNTPGFSAAIARYIDGDTSAIVLSNSDGKSLKDIARRVGRLAMEPHQN
jgi:CubicO group peptidase (beta-lactamase class C family)